MNHVLRTSNEQADILSKLASTKKVANIRHWSKKI